MDPAAPLPPSHAPVRTTDGTALAALSLSIGGFIGLGPLAWIPAIICGHIARARIRQVPALEGDNLARAGLIISYVGLVLCVVIILALAFFFIGVERTIEPQPELLERGMVSGGTVAGSVAS